MEKSDKMLVGEYLQPEKYKVDAWFTRSHREVKTVDELTLEEARDLLCSISDKLDELRVVIAKEIRAVEMKE